MIRIIVSCALAFGLASTATAQASGSPVGHAFSLIAGLISSDPDHWEFDDGRPDRLRNRVDGLVCPAVVEGVALSNAGRLDDGASCSYGTAKTGATFMLLTARLKPHEHVALKLEEMAEKARRAGIEAGPVKRTAPLNGCPAWRLDVSNSDSKVTGYGTTIMSQSGDRIWTLLAGATDKSRVTAKSEFGPTLEKAKAYARMNFSCGLPSWKR